jgi:excisionase family DNA binding protein
MADSHFTEPQVAAALKVDVRTLRRWRKAGKISYQRTPGGRVRYRLDDLIELNARMVVERTCSDI